MKSVAVYHQEVTIFKETNIFLFQNILPNTHTDTHTDIIHKNGSLVLQCALNTLANPNKPLGKQ